MKAADFFTVEGAVAESVLQKDSSLPAPNITLNLHRGCAVSELLIVVFFGGLLQARMLIFAAFCVYHPALSKYYLVDGQLVERYAYPLMCISTLLLKLGLLVCSDVVDKGRIRKV